MRLYPDAARAFVSDPASNLNTEASRNAYRKTLRLLHFTFPDHLVGDFTEHDLVEFCGRPELSPASQQAYRVRLQGFFSWAKWRGFVPEDPASNLSRMVKGSSHKPVRQHNWFTEDEVNRIMASIDTSTVAGRRRLVVARLGFTMGLRQAEIARVSWGQVDLERSQLRIMGKGRKLATLFVTDRTADTLAKWRLEVEEGLGRVPVDEPVVPAFQVVSNFTEGGQDRRVLWDRRVGGQTIHEIVRAINEEAGVRFTTHDMRRSFAGILEDRGMSIEDISAALRHSDIGTTQRYLEKRQDAAYQAVREIGFDL